MKESVRGKNLYRNSEGNWYYKKTINGNRYVVSLNTKEINEAASKRDFLNNLPDLITSGVKYNQCKSLSFYEVANHWFQA